MIDVINRMLAPLRTRIANMIARAVVQSVDDSTKTQLVQLAILEDEIRGEIERLQNYGFTSVPLEGAEAVVLFAGGRRDHGFAVAVDDYRHRPTGLQAGEVALYDQTGTLVKLKANGDVEITPSSGVVRVVGDVRADGISLKTHTHGAGDLLAPEHAGPVTGTSGGPL